MEAWYLDIYWQKHLFLILQNPDMQINFILIDMISLKVVTKKKHFVAICLCFLIILACFYSDFSCHVQF